MADNKKSFLLYCDLIYTIEKLTDEQAGKLLKHTLKYVNDQNPTPEDILTEIVFEPIKQSLKRDLLKYEGIRVKNKESADKRWAHKNNASASERMQTDTKNADSDSDKDSDKDKKNKRKEQVSKISFNNCDLFDKNVFKAQFSDWSKEKLSYYYEAALAYSNEGNKYIDWKATVNNWERRDKLAGKLKFNSNNQSKSKEQIIDEKKQYFKNQGF